MGLALFAVICVVVAGMLVTALPFIFGRNWDSLYDQRSIYQQWRDEWRERSLTRERPRSGLLTWMSSLRSNTMMGLLLNPKFFPTIMIVLSVLAAIVCFAARDYRRFVYWCASSVLITSVTY